MDIRTAPKKVNDSSGFRFLGVDDDNLVSIGPDDLVKTTEVYNQIKTDIENLVPKSEFNKENLALGNVDNTSDENKPVSIAQQSAIDTAYANSTDYTDQRIADLVNGAPSTLDTLGEIATAMAENEDVVDALNSAIGSKASQTELESHVNDNTVHITSEERTNWNYAKTHADSDHAPSNAEENQNAFSSISVSGDVITADSKTDSLTLEGNNVSLTADNENGKLTIGITKKNVTDALGYTPSEEGGGSGGGGTPITDIEISNVNGLQNVLDSKAASIHTHEIGDVNGLQNALDSKAASDHNHDNTYCTKIEIDEKLAAKANIDHSHAIDDVNGLQEKIDTKQDKPTTVTGTLSTGSTSITLSNDAITEDSTIDFYTSIYGVNPKTVTVISGNVTLTFDAQTTDMNIKVVIE